MNRAFLLPLFLSSLLIAGCGGGGSAGTADNGGQALVFGPFQTRSSGGQPQTVTNTLGGATVTGVAGAAFTKITYAPTPNVANSRLAFIRGNAPASALYIAHNDGSSPQPVPGVYPAFQASWSRDGRIAFDIFNTAVGEYEIWVVNSDGTNLHRITSGVNSLSPAWAMDNFHIAFARTDPTTGFHQIYTMTSSGGSLTLLSDGTADDTLPAWSPDGSQIYFLRYNTTFGKHQLWRMNSNGTSPQELFGLNNLELAISPLGTRMVNSYQSSPGADEIAEIVSLPDLSSASVILNTSGTQYDVESWSADGTRILYRKSVTASGTSELDSVTTDGNNPQTLASFGDGSVKYGTWEPYPVAIPYVSSSGGYTLNNASSGFLFAMNGSALGSFVNFTATTPGSATLTVDPITNGSTNLIYHVHADALNSFRYINGFGGGVSVVTVGPGTKEALVSFNATDGTVAAVLPVASKRGLVLASQKRGTQTVYTGAFSGVWDTRGKNIATGGASEVVLSQTGEAVSVRR